MEASRGHFPQSPVDGRTQWGRWKGPGSTCHQQSILREDSEGRHGASWHRWASDGQEGLQSTLALQAARWNLALAGRGWVESLGEGQENTQSVQVEHVCMACA